MFYSMETKFNALEITSWSQVKKQKNYCQIIIGEETTKDQEKQYPKSKRILYAYCLPKKFKFFTLLWGTTD